MANVKITELPVATGITSDDLLPIVESGSVVTQQANFQQVLTYVTSSTFDSLTVTSLTASVSGTFVGDGSGLDGVTAEWDGTHTGNAEITGTLAIKSGHVNLDSNAFFLQGTSTGASNVSLIGVNLHDQVVIGNSGYQNILDNSTYVSGNLEVAGNLTVDTITAREYYTEVVSASIIYQSGSTKFGDSADDTHQFTGSVSISGSLSVASGALDFNINDPSSISGISGTGFTLEQDAGGVAGLIYDSGDFSVYINSLVNTITSSDKVVSITAATLSASSFTGDGSSLTNLTASNINNFTNDVRAQFTAGTDIGISAGVISYTGSVVAPVGPEYSIQFNSGSTFSGSSDIVWRYDTSEFNVTGDVNISGTLTATAKSFDIEHPTKQGMRLRYGSLEGPENGVYVRGTTTEKVIELPDYWTGLVDEETITVNLTPVGLQQTVWVDKIEENKVYIGGDLAKCYFTVFGERKDIPKLETEF